MPGKAATFAICFTPGRNPPIPWNKNIIYSTTQYLTCFFDFSFKSLACNNEQ